MARKKIPYLAVDSSMLGDRLGKTVICHICGKEHNVLQSDNCELQLIKCGDKEYLVGVDGYKIILKAKKKRRQQE